MANSDSEQMSEAKQRGHNEVTGTATIEPGMFTEPTQEPRGIKAKQRSGALERQLSEISSTVTSTIAKSWETVRKAMPRSRLIAALIGFGLGMLVERSRHASARRKWRRF
jgi:hypothetical protein